MEIKDIVFIETYGRHLRVSTVESVYEFVGNISLEEKTLSEYGFVRCHKGYVINMYFIKKLDKNVFVLSDDRTIPIGRGFKDDTVTKFTRYLTGYCI